MTAASFHAKSTALEVVRGLNAELAGKVVIVTGATSGTQSNERQTQEGFE